MRKVLLQFALPIGIVVAAGLLFLKPYLASRTEQSHWNDPLRKAAAGADRLVVRDLGFRGKDPEPDVEIQGAEKIGELFKLIDIDPERSGSHCMCDGEYRIHVFEGDQEVLVLGYHHGHALRWHGGAWKGNAHLTEAAQKALPAWFQKNGCTYFQQLRDLNLAREEKGRKESERFASFFPEKSHHYLFGGGAPLPGEKDVDGIGRKIADFFPDGESVALAVCKAMGSLDNWVGTTSKENAAVAAISTVDGKQFVGALQKLKDDRRGLRGAARIFFRVGFEEKVPAEVRNEWIVQLAEIVFSDDLDDHDKPELLRQLSRERDPKIKALLQDVFRGKVGKEINLKEAFGQEPGLRTGAALTLVLMGDDSIKAEIKGMLKIVRAKADIAALETCLALLGDPAYIRTENMQLESFNIGSAILKAIERFKGKHGMEALVKGGINHPWLRLGEESVRTFERITGHHWSAADIEDWWEVEHEGKRLRPQPVRVFDAGAAYFTCVKFSPDGKLIAAGSTDRKVKVWNPQSGELVHDLRGHDLAVFDVAFHPDRKQLASANGDTTIKTWDLATGKEIRTLRGHQKKVNWVTYSPDGQSLASASDDGTVRLWDTATGTPRLSFAGHKSTHFAGHKSTHEVRCAIFRPDGQRIASTGFCDLVRIWNPANGDIEHTLKGYPDSVDRMVYSPDGKELITDGGAKNTLRVWDATAGIVLRTLNGHTNAVQIVTISPDGKQIASSDWDNVVKIWDAATGKDLATFRGHREKMTGLVYSPDGKRLATSSEDKTIRIWDLEKIVKNAAGLKQN